MVHEWCMNVYLHLSSDCTQVCLPACTHACVPACLCTPVTYNESLVLWSTQLLQIEVQHYPQPLYHTLQEKAKTRKDRNTQRRSDSLRYTVEVVALVLSVCTRKISLTTESLPSRLLGQCCNPLQCKYTHICTPYHCFRCFCYPSPTHLK